MHYRDLGKTGLRVSALSYGAAALGDVYGTIDQATGIRAVHTAVDLGINLIDVSPYYGLTRAETVLGRALKEIPRARYYLSTKVGRYGANEFDFSASRVTASVDESLARLNLDDIDIILCHDIEFASLEQIVNETLPALRQLRAEGKVRFVGVSGLPLKIFSNVLDHADVDVILSYCHYDLQDSSLADLIPYLKTKKVGIMNAAPTAMGLLTRQGTQPWHPAPAEIKAICAQAATYCEAQGSNIVQLAIQFAIANPDIATTIVGSADPHEIENDVAWAEQPLDLNLLAEVESILAPVHNQTWQSGRAENN
jgi:L-galactose dehydrogenase